MNSKSDRLSAAALALVICVSVAPVTYAAKADKDAGVRAKVIQFLKKVQQTFYGITSLDDYPHPPRP